MRTIISVLFVFLSTLFQFRATLQFEIASVCHQLAVYQRLTLRPRVQSADRLFWAWLSSTIGGRLVRCGFLGTTFSPGEIPVHSANLTLEVKGNASIHS